MTDQPTINSMTAFARVQGDTPQGSFHWELRSVNHRYLETSFKLPEHFRALEPQLRDSLRQHLTRGKVECSLHFKGNEDQRAPELNAQRLETLQSLGASLAKQFPDAAAMSIKDLLAWPGVLQAQELDIDSITAPLLAGFTQALEQLCNARLSEGERLSAMIADRLRQIDELVQLVQQRMPEILSEHQLRLEKKLADMQVEVDKDRLAQELVLQAQKTDVAEELDRLSAHTQEVRDTLTAGEPCGRRLDFLMQELNREANTLGSKSIAIDTSRGAVNLKVLIEQMREQVQNIE